MTHRGAPVLASLAVLIGLGGCRQEAWNNEALAARIERQVESRRPDLRLERFARFYARGPNDSVTAVYVYANPGYDPIVGSAGEIVWTTPDALPLISDGGCGVLNVDYDAAADRLRSIACS